MIYHIYIGILNDVENHNSELQHIKNTITQSSCIKNRLFNAIKFWLFYNELNSLERQGNSVFPTFIVKSKTSGSTIISNDKLCKVVAEAIQNISECKPSLKKPEIMFKLTLNSLSKTLLIGLEVPLSKYISFQETGVAVGEGLSNNGRKLSVTSLRPTIAYSLLNLAHIEEGDIILDPMAGNFYVMIFHHEILQIDN